MKKIYLFILCAFTSTLLKAQCSPTITPSASNICAGQTTTLTASGGTTYTWSPGGLNTSAITVSPTSTTVYTLSATTGTCVASATVQISVTATPTLNPTANPSSICAGGSATLTANATSATAYTWSPGGASSNTMVVSPTSTSVYTIDASNGACAATNTVAVMVSNPTITVTSGATVCAGSSATLTASGATTYTWSPGTGLNMTTGNPVVATPTSTTVYTVTGSVGTCSAITTTTVTVNPIPNVTATNNGPVCEYATITFSAAVSGGASYSWSGPNAFSSTLQNPSITNATSSMSGTYMVTVTDINGCVGSATTSVTVNALPVVTVNSATICLGQQTATLTANGASTYTWSPGQTSAALYVSPTSTTMYTVTGTDLNGCINSAMTTVTVNSLPNVTVNSTAICTGGTGVLTANGASSYTWSPASGLSSSNGSPVSATPSSTTSYTVVGMDANGCTSTAVATVVINPLPIVTFTLQADTAPHVWDVYPTYSGGMSPYIATWNWGDGSTNAGLYPSHTYSAAGTYSICVSITDANGCVASYCQNDSVYRSANSTMVQVDVINTATGIKNINGDHSLIKIYPDPASDEFTVSSANAIRSVTIFNSLGRLVRQQSAGGTLVKVNITSLSEGIYFVTVQSASGVFTQKILVQR